MSLNICEIFYSLQGESTYSGLPCIFIRLSGCNLRCSWCDTTYTWSNGKEMSIEQILQEIRKYPCSLVEITGGEPLLQKRTIELMEILHQEKYRILLETNGTQSLQNVPDYVVKIVDVKCPGSGFGESFLMENLNFLLPVDEIKFVHFAEEKNFQNIRYYCCLIILSLDLFFLQLPKHAYSLQQRNQKYNPEYQN